MSESKRVVETRGTLDPLSTAVRTRIKAAERNSDSKVNNWSVKPMERVSQTSWPFVSKKMKFSTAFDLFFGTDAGNSGSESEPSNLSEIFNYFQLPKLKYFRNISRDEGSKNIAANLRQRKLIHNLIYQ